MMEETNNTPNTVEGEPIVVDASMVEPVGDASQFVEAEVCVTKSKGRKPKSIVWNHFSKLRESGSTKAKGAICNYCKKHYAWVSENGTSSLKKHVNMHQKSLQQGGQKAKKINVIWVNKGRI